MTDHITHDELMDALSDCGKAMGFAISTAITAALAGTGIEDAVVAQIQAAIGALTEADRFSPHVSLCMNGFVEGIDAFQDAPADIDDMDELI